MTLQSCRCDRWLSVAATAFLITTSHATVPASAGPDACTLDDPVAICRGDQSNGVASGTDFPGTYTLLLINGLTTDIAPSSGLNGVEFTSINPITLSVNSGDFAIVTSGGGVGIFASSNGAVVLNSIADINTSGDNSDGILAGSNDTLMLTSLGDITTTGNDARGIAAATTPSGDLTLASIGNITTSGNNAAAIFATNIAGTITVLSTGNITTSGSTSDGIQAGSIDGDVDVLTSGDISATGANSVGIAVSSATGDLSVIIASGSVTGGSASGAGVQFIGGATNTLDNFGNISALSGLAVSGDSNDETINNFGTITGDVDLGSGTNAFNNFLGGRFDAGATVDLGGGTLTNAGILAPGGSGAVQATSLTGDLVQTSTGTYAVDLDPLGSTTADFIVATGSASLDGRVVTRLLSVPTGSQTYTIVVAGSPVTDLGATLVSSPALHAALLFSGNLVQIATDVNFGSVSGLNGNQQAISRNLHQAFLAGGGSLQPVFLGLLNTDSLDAYRAALDQLSPQILSDAQISTLYASLGFANAMLSCKVNGQGTTAIIEEGQCLWAGASATFVSQNTANDLIGYSDQTGSFAGGVQVALDDNWRLGFGAGYQSTSLSSSSLATSEGNVGQAGFALKYNVGSFLVAGTITGGRGWYETKRAQSFGGFTGLAESDTTIDILNGGLRLAYVFGAPQLYFKPVLDAAVTQLDLDGFSETGSAANLAVSGSTQTVYTIVPSVEMGSEWWLSNSTLVRPFLRGGVSFYEGGNLALNASFTGAPAGVSPFTIETDMDDVMGVVGAGLDMITSQDTVLHLTYDGQFGETTSIQSVALKGSVRY